MNDKHIVLAAGAGLIGIAALTRNSDGAQDGFFAGQGDDRGVGTGGGETTTINFPDLDLSNIWADDGPVNYDMSTKKTRPKVPSGGTTNYFGHGSMEAARSSLAGKAPSEYSYNLPENRVKISMATPKKTPSLPTKTAAKEPWTPTFAGVTTLASRFFGGLF